MAQLGIFELPIFSDYIMPFLLMFVVVFAILEKTELLGKGKKQINSIVAFIFSLIFIALPGAVKTTQDLVPVIGVIIIILLSFLMLFGFVGGQVGPGKEGLNKGLRITFGILIGLAILATLMWSTGLSILPFFDNETVLSSILLIVFIIAIFSVVLSTTPGENTKPKY